MSAQRRESAVLGAFARVLLGLGALALAGGCTKKGEGLVLVEVSSGQTIDHATVLVTAPADQTKLGTASATWPSSPPLKIGVYIPQTYSGAVDVIACGFDASGKLVAASPTDPASFNGNVQAGAASSIVMVSIAAGGGAPLCGAITGAGGNGGSSGGAGGAASTGTGGTSSTGGTSGTGGGAGATGKGGTSGTGGTAGAPATGGSNGTGGVTGTGGAAGAPGTGGGTGTWAGATNVATDPANGESFPSVAVDGNGNAVVVYEDGSQIWAVRYDASTATWGTPGAVDSRGTGNISKPSVGVDKNGNYLAVWALDSSTTLKGIWQSTSTDGKTWTTPTSISVAEDFGPVLSMNASGGAVVAFEEQITGSNNIQAVASIRSPGTTAAAWSAPQVMRPGDDNGDRYPAVAIDGSGNAFVGWVQTDGTATNYYDRIWMRQYTAGGGWNAAGLFESYADQASDDVSIAVNSSGDAIVTYTQITTANPAAIQIWARRYSAVNLAFETNPSMVVQENTLDTVVNPSVTLDDAGNATVAFAVGTVSGTYQVYTSRAAATDAAWPGSPTAMESDDTAQNDTTNNGLGYVTMPVVKHDPAGNVTLVWRKRTAASGARFDLVGRRYTAGAWGPQVALGSSTANSVMWPTLAVGTNGTAVTTWFFDVTYDLWANVFH